MTGADGPGPGNPAGPLGPPPTTPTGTSGPFGPLSSHAPGEPARSAAPATTRPAQPPAATTRPAQPPTPGDPVPLSPTELAGPDRLGGKGHGLVTLLRLGLPVPPGFVIPPEACRAYLRDGTLPAGLAAAARDLRVPLVSVRSGAQVAMPGMMDTLLNVDPGSVRLREAVAAVFSSWLAPRAVTYRELHGIPHDLGTAVVVQAMVSGDRDEHSGSGVAFSRDPSSGVRRPYGDVLFQRPGSDVVSGSVATRPLADLQEREPAVWAALLDGLDRVERHYRDVCHVEFTFESGRLWFLQVRAGGLAGRAAVRVAVDLADEAIIDRATAVRRVSAQQWRAARITRIRLTDGLDVIARGTGAVPGVATGRIALTADRAARMAAAGPVILIRPHTSPLDMHGLAAAAGIVTATGGPASHAAVVARTMGKPAIVSVTGLAVDPAAGRVLVTGRAVPEGFQVTVDGTGGELVAGTAATTTGDSDPYAERLLSWARALR